MVAERGKSGIKEAKAKSVRIDVALIEILDKVKAKINENMYGVLEDISYYQASKVLSQKIKESNIL